MAADSEMVERVARAIMWRPEEWVDLAPEGQAELLRAARAIILAMREPTEAMVLANPAWNIYGGVYEGWRAMIDAALSQKQDEGKP